MTPAAAASMPPSRSRPASTERGSLHLAGTAVATAEVVTVVRPVERGEILKDADVLIERRPRTELTRDIITDRERAVGLAARAPLQPGRVDTRRRADEAGAGPAR